MDVKTRWSASVIAVLAAGLAAQIGIAQVANTRSASQTAETWLTGSLGITVDTFNALVAEDIEERASLLVLDRAFQDHVEASDRGAIDVMVTTTFTRDDMAWMAFDRSGRTFLAGGPQRSRCDHQPLVGHDPPMIMRCGDRARLVVSVDLLSGGWAERFAVGLPLDGAYTSKLSRLTWSEVVLLDDARVVTTLKQQDGTQIRTALPEDVLGSIRASDQWFGAHRLVLPAYRGYRLTGDFAERAPGARWFVASRRISERDPIFLALVAPTSFFTAGVRASGMILAFGSLLLLLVLASLVSGIVGRFSDPVAALVQSARAVAKGKLDTKVRVPPTGEMRELCATYNDMLDQVRTRMTLERNLSREIGRAEISTGVLHNLGNVLNSVNVAASRMMEQTDSTYVDRLERLAVLMKEDESLRTALARADRGPMLSQYVESLAATTATAHMAQKERLDGLTKHLDHMRAVVLAHQEFARHKGMVELCVVAELVDHALVMTGVPWTHEGIEIEIVTRGRKAVYLDRHRTLQVLVNLLRNARDALVSGAFTMPRITVEADATQSTALRIRVVDNGCGLAEEQLVRVFAHGFTTKRDGHGFGLHASALAAQEMGGTLTCSSAGPGQGAVFTLDIPTQALTGQSLPPVRIRSAGS
ncbi:MAG: HAMP domain-containing protein [Deltaproteobacteria bacterium]|nr:HAMP domain-containing protein [Deltaproteobacteria bacterium]MBW2253654.1 HAMP domain-containing protein [Deltaproteobacteria bacterium]